MTAIIKKQNIHKATIPFDVCDTDTAKQVLLSLIETIASRICADRAYVSVVAAFIVDYEFFHSSKKAEISFISASHQHIPYFCKQTPSTIFANPPYAKYHS